MCEMERGSVKWEDTDRIDRIRRAHAQKHAPARGGWAKPSDPGKKPWFCKNFQSGNCTHSRDHEFNGKLQKHICNTYQVTNVQQSTSQKGGGMLMFQLKTKFSGPMRRSWVDLTDRGSLTTNCLSSSGSKGSAKTF